jgi:uncharacterized membrane-anchored protein
VIRRPRKKREEERDAAPPGVIVAAARVDPRTKNLMTRLSPGEVAIINHADIDRIAAEGLIQRQAAAVVNASRSSTGRYPNLGPLLLVTAGIPLIDDVGPSIMAVEEGAMVAIRKGRIYREDAEGEELGRGDVLTLEEVERRLDEAKHDIASVIEDFAENTIDFIRDERDVLIEVARLPEVKTDFHGRHVLVVVRGYDYKEDLGALRAYIRETKPLLIAVDGGADALLDFGLKPDMIIGDMDSVTTEALLTGAELVVHAYPDGDAPGLERLEALGLPCTIFEAPGTSEDIAMLLAYEHGAQLLVAVGTHANLIEFLDKGRKGMASTFLTRLRVGPILVDAKGVSRLYRGRVRRVDLVMLVIAALVTMAIVVWLSEPMRLTIEVYLLKLQQLWFSIKQAVFG